MDTEHAGENVIDLTLCEDCAATIDRGAVRCIDCQDKQDEVQAGYWDDDENAAIENDREKLWP